MLTDTQVVGERSLNATYCAGQPKQINVSPYDQPHGQKHDTLDSLESCAVTDHRDGLTPGSRYKHPDPSLKPYLLCSDTTRTARNTAPPTPNWFQRPNGDSSCSLVG